MSDEDSARHASGERMAQWLLCMVTPRLRAEAIIGDLSEQRSAHSAFWFWQSTIRIAAASGLQLLFSLLTSPRETDMSADSFPRRIWAHKWLLVACVLASVATTSIALTFLPVRYRSESRILVVPALISDEYVHLPKSDRIAIRLTAIQRQILSRTRLERIVQELDLYSDMRQHAVMEDVIETMRRDIGLEMIGDDSFRVSYSGSNPRTVQQVTELLGSLFIKMNSDNRENSAGSTRQFIENQVDEERDRLTRREAEINVAARAGHPPTLADTIELDVLQQQYRALLSKREEAQLAENLYRRQIGEQFTIIEGPRTVTPLPPDRLAIHTGGAVAGFGIGIALIAFTTRRRPALESASPDTDG